MVSFRCSTKAWVRWEFRERFLESESQHSAGFREKNEVIYSLLTFFNTPLRALYVLDRGLFESMLTSFVVCDPSPAIKTTILGQLLPGNSQLGSK